MSIAMTDNQRKLMERLFDCYPVAVAQKHYNNIMQIRCKNCSKQRLLCKCKGRSAHD